MRLLVIAGFVIAALSGVTLILAGPGYRFEILALGTAFGLMRWAAYGGIAAMVVSLLGLVLVRQRDTQVLLLGVLGLIIGGLTLWVPWSWLRRARSVPPIHDITTDTENPPAFRAVLPLRADAPNSAEYGGPEIARQQQEAYPEIRPLTLRASPEVAFERALAAARDMGWELVAADSAEGRIEATATTTWFGFKDDVVVRITPAEGGSRIDVRSVSRVGRSDIGTNARRIRTYLDRLTS